MSLAARLALIVAIVVMAVEPAAPAADQNPFRRGTVLHAHNCYPEHGKFHDRLPRALETGLRPVAIEQDLVWIPPGNGRPGRSVVSHGEPIRGDEPTLEEHFFPAARPIIERALAENRPDQWPVLILHFDFKTNEPEHHRAVWDLLGRYESWLTTAERVADASRRMPLQPGPLLVLTENGDGQSVTFHDRVPIGGRLRLFGTLPSAMPDLSTLTPPERAARQASAPPEVLMPGPGTNYRRWTNHSWAVVERGGQNVAGEWTADENRRLRALVDRAHAMNLWFRFYALNGYEKDPGQGWSAGYNFGSVAAAQKRWDAAIAAGVDLLATDQYELFAARLKK